ncbi:unnamed protein product [Adineta ricciae]|uniref:HAT C-terminal dimerisation domain-containing protein n=1 Tax=Adineta ricciae TaxID=249248 RepID=A0A814QG38_ADIRI|nr:unnamed protein product [Adineta ricciae]CAF1315383.1 unnamed protein product [Adineta ricciae]
MKESLVYLKKLITQLDLSINKRFSGIVQYLMHQSVSDDESYYDPDYFAGTVLDHQLKFHWLQQMNYNPSIESKMKQLLAERVLDNCRQISDASSNLVQYRTRRSSSSPRTFNNSTTESGNVQGVKRLKLFHYDDGVNSIFESNLSPIDELNMYLADPVRAKFSVYWQRSQLSSLETVVRRVFSIQASSAPVERAFSQAGLILSPRRTSILTELV